MAAVCNNSSLRQFLHSADHQAVRSKHACFVSLCNNRRIPFNQQPPRARRLVTSASAAQESRRPLIKICGVTSEADATMAAEAGADFVGMILWPRTKRTVGLGKAKAIAIAARAGGAEPVAVFVDEDARAITAACGAIGVELAQLHGDSARRMQPHLRSVNTIYVLHATPEGEIQTALPSVAAPTAPRQPEWMLVDGLSGGTGEALDWSSLKPPAGESVRGWILAGGLNPSNVGEAVAICNPDVVDVSSGVTGPDGIAKDADKVLAFIEAASGLSPKDCRSRRDEGKR